MKVCYRSIYSKKYIINSLFSVFRKCFSDSVAHTLLSFYLSVKCFRAHMCYFNYSLKTSNGNIVIKIITKIAILKKI